MKLPTQKHILFAGLLIAGLLQSAPVRAEEGGSGHYVPGQSASFIDALPDKPSFNYANFYTYYNGSAGASRPLDLAGQIAVNVEGTVNADTSVLMYRTPLNIFGASYATAFTLPYVWMDVKGNVSIANRTRTQSDYSDGIGDVEFFPAMLGWKHGDLKWGANLGIYAPTGSFEKGHLANVGKNYWTFQPGVNISYLSSTIGLELSAFAGIDINTKNQDTDYLSGDQFHIDATVAEHLPLGPGFIGVGASGYYYEQVTGDSGDGARLGDFRGRTLGGGPVLSYFAAIGNVNLIGEVKWLHEFEVTNRLEGDYIWIKLVVSF